MRDYNSEARSLPEKRYDYEFDGLVRQYMMRSFEPFFRLGPALELGCHEGASTRALAEVFPDLTVVEASSEAIERARTSAPTSVKFLCGTFESIELENRFSNIFLINTLEHLDDSVVVLRRIRSWLAPGARFFVLVPNADAPSRQIAVLMGLISANNAITPGEWAHGHRRTYSFDTLEADLRSAGFEVVQRGGVMFKPLANFQIDRALEAGIIDSAYIEGIYKFGMLHPQLCASIFMICRNGDG